MALFLVEETLRAELETAVRWCEGERMDGRSPEDSERRSGLGLAVSSQEPIDARGKSYNTIKVIQTGSARQKNFHMGEFQRLYSDCDSDSRKENEYNS